MKELTVTGLRAVALHSKNTLQLEGVGLELVEEPYEQHRVVVLSRERLKTSLNHRWMVLEVRVKNFPVVAAVEAPPTTNGRGAVIGPLTIPVKKDLPDIPMGHWNKRGRKGEEEKESTSSRTSKGLIEGSINASTMAYRTATDRSLNTPIYSPRRHRFTLHHGLQGIEKDRIASFPAVRGHPDVLITKGRESLGPPKVFVRGPKPSPRARRSPSGRSIEELNSFGGYQLSSFGDPRQSTLEGKDPRQKEHPGPSPSTTLEFCWKARGSIVECKPSSKLSPQDHRVGPTLRPTRTRVARDSCGCAATPRDAGNLIFEGRGRSVPGYGCVLLAGVTDLRVLEVHGTSTRAVSVTDQFGLLRA
ncbi:hypothetical protein BDN72DRAFT_863891 [Pluteus cervinus]|uniref:Uncharacterized protein n=1 Tax=Pluteus cervinus TaxID=181527 RepID=A0ACD3A5S0_9AGAR|nr:hypothetical protein BDN72DRAFT_863891 [Pluteus cervinus]